MRPRSHPGWHARGWDKLVRCEVPGGHSSRQKAPAACSFRRCPLPGSLFGKFCRGGLVHYPKQRTTHRLDELRRQPLWLVWPVDNFFEHARLGGPGNHENNILSEIDDWRSQREPVGIYFFHPHRSKDVSVIFEHSGVRKERSGVPVFSQAQENNVELRRLIGSKRFPQNALVIACCFLRRWQLRQNAMNILRRNGHFGDHGLLGHAEVAVGMIGRNVALIAQKKMQIGPLDAVAPLRTGQQFVKCLGSGSAAKRQGSTAVGGNCLGGELNKELSALAVEGITVAADDDVRLGHPGYLVTPARMNSSMARAKPSSLLLLVTRCAAFCTSGLALPMAMLKPLFSNISTSLEPSPMVAMFSLGMCSSSPNMATARPLLA